MSRRRKQILWFIGLWLAGILAVGLLSLLIRTVMSVS